MKRLLIYILLLGIFSCADYSLLEDFWFLKGKYSELNTVKQIENYIIDNINYRSDKEKFGKEHDQTPEETEDKLEGNCKDMAIFMVALIYKRLKKEAKILLVDTNGTGQPNHAVVYFEGHKYLIVDSGYCKVYRTLEFNRIPEEVVYHR